MAGAYLMTRAACCSPSMCVPRMPAAFVSLWLFKAVWVPYMQMHMAARRR